MKFAAMLSLATGALAGVLDQRDCHANNCAREVTGTRSGLLPIASRQADCSSFLVATVTPPAATVTVTVTAGQQAPAKREAKRFVACGNPTVYPTAIPAYASSCLDVGSYSSVCSCWGIAASTSTAPQPIVTATLTLPDTSCEIVY